MRLLRDLNVRTTAAAAIAAVTVTTVLAAAPPAAAQTAQVIVVAPTGAPGADDAGPGTRAEPLATLEETQRRVRDLADDGDVTVQLLDGTYRLDQPLRFDADDSGRDGHTVTWQAAPGAEPVLSGARPVTGWELDDPTTGVYKADVGTGFDSRQLYVNGVVAQKARISLPRTAITLNPTGFTLNDPNLAYLADLPQQERIEFQALQSFTNRFAPVQSISGTTVVMQQPAWDNNTYGYDSVTSPFRTPRYFLLNSKSFLDEGGEWYLDTAAGVLYYKPLDGQDLSSATVELPRLETLVEVGGTYDEPVRNLRFEGITFTGTTWLHPSSSNGYANQQTGTFINGVQPDRPADAFTSCAVGCRGFEASRNHWWQAPAAVQVSAAENISVVDGTFVNLGSVGLGIGNDANAHSTGVGLGASDVSVVGSTFTASAGGGIVVGGVQPDAHHPPDLRMVNKDILISNNRVYSTALEYLDQDAIFASYVSGLTIEHNYVSDMPYTGIGVGYGWGANDPGGSPEYINRGLYDFQPIYETPTTLKDVRIVGNYVRNVIQTMFDAGCIYTLSAMPGSTIDENLCENSRQLGLYFDEGSRYISASGNVFLNNAGQWAHANNQNGNRTGDLTLIGNYATNSAITGLVNGSRGNIVRDNVAVTGGNLPIEASRVIFEAGPEGKYRGPADPQRPPVGAFLTADPVSLDAGGATTVTATVANLTDERVSGLTAGISVPEGWAAVRQGKPLSPALDPGASATVSWTVTAPASFSSPVSQATVQAALSLRADGLQYAVNRSLTLTALNPLTSLASYGSVPSRFAEAGGQFAILTAGADIWQDGGGAFDEYGTIYQDDAVGDTATVTARVTQMDNTNPWAKAGVVIRNDVTAAGSSAGYAVMVVTPGNGVAFQWDANGNGYLDSFSGAGGVRAPAWVRLVREGTQVSGYYSTNGSTWIKVGPTVTLAGIASTQDAGLIATSHAAGVTGQFSFADFSVT
ncbi:right-handed parallel beta-helix repeat-containing protein [Jiangella aurantiaca]|uniref:Right-handed parallel beta-helix repeat-containing protein n=1 Tax=Jiangella aurantiaca TaxID=2530373 RepID=A0A4R5AM98_9ACTN|nr:NEW3 domain-containing protein [Jiangella aurantiaca]TDD72669.1 right-handed parallel beta-helix repeat-containing protein [Jiangella aurantiaca]